MFENFVHFFSCRFYCLNLIFDIVYFSENPEFFELPSVFKDFIDIYILLYFMDFMQLNSTNDAPYFCTPKEFVMFAFWLFGFGITWFLIKIVFKLILQLIFITFIIYFILKLYIFTKVFIHNLANIFRNVFYIIFRILLIFTFYCFEFFAIILLIYISVNLLHVFRNFAYFIFYLHVLVLILTKIKLIQLA